MARTPNFKIDSSFTERWSPRAMTGEALPKEVLQSALEAARWAPSGGNTQPWRFVYSLHGSETCRQSLDFIQSEGKFKNEWRS